MQHIYGDRIGFSDHSWGTAAAVGAVCLGATIIEKHFTLDRNLPGPDHRFSSDPEELGLLVREIRTVEAAMGSSSFQISPEEKAMADQCHRSIAFKLPVNKGEKIKLEHLAFQRPGTGLKPYNVDEVIGGIATGNWEKGQLLTRGMFYKND